MSENQIQLVLFGLQEAIKSAPGIVGEIQALLATADPTGEAWDALRARVAAKTYKDFVPQSALPSA